MPFFGGPPYPISDYFDPSTDFSDCDHPAESNNDLILTEDMFPEPGTYAMNNYFIFIGDSADNVSNEIDGISLIVHFQD